MSKINPIPGIPAPYLNAQRRRQAVLDFLHGNPSSALPTIERHMLSLGDNDSMDNTMRTMLGWDEISFTGGHGRRRYSAIAATTRSAEQVMEDRGSKVLKKAFDDHIDKPVRNRPGHYVHRMGEHPIRNQGGQGALRHTTYIDCQQFY
jgi:hypothetical protein